MPSDPTADDLAREQAIVDEALAAIEGRRSGATDHDVERRRVQVVIDAIRDAW
jgi:hypothetical protein